MWIENELIWWRNILRGKKESREKQKKKNKKEESFRRKCENYICPRRILLLPFSQTTFHIPQEPISHLPMFTRFKARVPTWQNIQLTQPDSLLLSLSFFRFFFSFKKKNKWFFGGSIPWSNELMHMIVFLYFFKCSKILD